MTQTTQKKSPKDITSLNVPTQRVKLPDHRITPAECEIIKELSRRGSGIAYLARHPEVEGYLLIKAFIPEYTVTEDVTGRWTRVSRMAEDLHHPRLARVLGVGLMENVPCIVREYIEGKTFEEMLRDGSLDLRQGMFYLAQALEGVEDAHGHRLVHGNIKPSNIIVDLRGRVVVADPGLYPPPNAPETSEHFVSSLPYMPPEILSGATVLKPSADIYSSAAVLYDLAANRPPFTAATIDEMRHNILSGDFVPPTRVNPKTSKMVEFLIAQSLAVDPEKRYGSLHALVVDIHRVHKGQKPLSYQEKRSPFLSFLKTVFYTILTLALLAALGWGGYEYWNKRQNARYSKALNDARTAFRKGDFNAVTTMTAELDGSPFDKEANLLEAGAYLNLKRPDRALPTLDQLLGSNLSPAVEARAKWLKMRALVDLGKVKDARTVFAAMDPGAFILFVDRQDMEAFLKDVAAANPSSASARNELIELIVTDILPKAVDKVIPALIWRTAGGLVTEPEKAATLFRMSLGVPEQDDATLKGTASVLAELFSSGKLKFTPEDAKVLSVFPEVLSDLGQELMLRGQESDAEFAWKALSSRKNLPESAGRMLKLLEAKAVEADGKTSEALNRYLDLGVKNDAAGLWALSLAARLRLNAGDTRSSAADFKSIESDTNTPLILRVQASIYLGHCWRAQGRSDQSLPFYRKAREASRAPSTTIEAMVGEIEALAETGSLEESHSLLRSLRSISADSPDTLACAYLLLEADKLPKDFPRFHGMYLQALRLELDKRNAEAAEVYRALETEAADKSWYSLVARFRKNLFKNK
jgi:serine/threonine protein kinase